MSFSSVPSIKSGTSSPAKTITPSSLSPRSPTTLSSFPLTSDNLSSISSAPVPGASTLIPLNATQSKTYKLIGDEAWKKCEKVVQFIKYYL